MEKQKSFKERVKETLIYNADAYKRYYIDYEYLLVSNAFEKSKYYIVTAHEDNYLHLTGVHTELGAKTFFERCFDGTLEETDFDFCKKGQNESEVKGSVRRKINALPAVMDMFSIGTLVEEDFEKNRIRCSLAAGNVSATLGFVVAGKAKPMTLLKGNELNPAKVKKLDLVLRRKSGETNFSEVLIGTEAILSEYKDILQGLLSEKLNEAMEIAHSMTIKEKEGVTMCNVLDAREARGKAEGEERMAKLVNILLQSGKNEEALRVTTDEDFREQCYALYKI